MTEKTKMRFMVGMLVIGVIASAFMVQYGETHAWSPEKINDFFLTAVFGTIILLALGLAHLAFRCGMATEKRKRGAHG